MARFDWDAARSRDLVRERGTDYVGSDFRRDEDRPKRKSKAKRLTGRTHCAATDRNHLCSRAKSLPHCPGFQIKECKNCGKVFIRTSATTKWTGLLGRAELSRRLARLTGAKSESLDSDRIVRSRSNVPRRSPVKRKGSIATSRSNFDLRIHFVHEQPETRRWVCVCSWPGSGEGSLVKAQELHRKNWISLSAAEQRSADTEALQGLHALLNCEE
jgi:hypothetical protein